MKEISLFALLVSFSLPSAQAAHYVATSPESCSTIDFRETFPMKIRDQNGISWCFAHAAADYLQYTYQLPEQISAADIAIAYSETGVSKVVQFFKSIFSRNPDKKVSQTGFIAKAIKKIRPQGYCPEATFPSDYWEQVDSKSGQITRQGLLDSILEIYSLQTRIKSGAIPSANDLPHYYAFNNLNKDQFYFILKNSTQSKVLPQIRNTVCSKERRPFPLGPIKSSFKLRSKHIFENINKNFNSRMPSSIDFFSGIFDDYDHYKKNIGDLHTVLLYGRSFDPEKNECVYLMKNSYGESCFNSDGTSKYNAKIRCENGYLYFPESDLFKSILTYLQLKRL